MGMGMGKGNPLLLRRCPLRRLQRLRPCLRTRRSRLERLAPALRRRQLALALGERRRRAGRLFLGMQRPRLERADGIAASDCVGARVVQRMQRRLLPLAG